MSLRMVTPASGGSQLSFSWDCGTSVLCAGSVLDVPAGGPLESAIGVSNLTALSGNLLADALQGTGGPATSNTA